MKNNRVIFINPEKFHTVHKDPRAPKLYGVIKIPEGDFPIEAVVSYIISPARTLGKNVNHLFKVRNSNLFTTQKVCVGFFSLL